MCNGSRVAEPDERSSLDGDELPVAAHADRASAVSLPAANGSNNAEMAPQ